MVKARPYDGTIAVATHGNGIYTASLPPVEAANVSFMNTFSADVTVYPNPFINRVQWSFETKHTFDLRLKVYDLKGNVVHFEERKRQAAGSHNMEWTTNSSLPRGTYLYSLLVGGAHKTGKIIHQ